MTHPQFKWRPEHIDEIYELMHEGEVTTIKQLATHFNTSRETIYNWCKSHQEFREAVMRLKMENWLGRTEEYGVKE